MRTGLIVSLLIHILLLALLVIGGHGKGNGDTDKKNKGKGEEQSTLVPNGDKPKDDSSVEVDIIKAIPKNSNAPKAPECTPEKSYGGIGIVLNFFENSIDECPEYYPAFKAGLRKGDIILGQDEIRGEPGTQITISVKRQSEILTFTVTREKICTE